jgi:hypothetical protein
MKIVVTDEERKPIMKGFPDRKRNDLVSDRTNGIKGEDEGKFFVEKVIKCVSTKRGRKSFL